MFLRAAIGLMILTAFPGSRASGGGEYLEQWSPTNEAVSTDNLNQPRYYYQRGERVIWRSDFAEIAEGVFPSNMEIVHGQAEVHTVLGRNYLGTVDGAVLALILPEDLPHRFSIEIEYGSPDLSKPFLFEFYGATLGSSKCVLGTRHYESFVECEGNRITEVADLPSGGLVHPRFTVDGDHVTGYINEQLLPALPNVKIVRGNRVRITVPGGTEESPTLISVINVAEGGERTGI